MESKRVGRLHGRLNACSYYISFTSVIASLTGHSRYSYNTPHSVRFMTSHKTKPDSRQPSQSLNRFFTLINIGKYTPVVPTSVPTRQNTKACGGGNSKEGCTKPTTCAFFFAFCYSNLDQSNCRTKKCAYICLAC